MLAPCVQRHGQKHFRLPEVVCFAQGLHAEALAAPGKDRFKGRGVRDGCRKGMALTYLVGH